MNQIRQYSIILSLGALPAAILILILYACDLLIEKVKKELVESRITSLKVFSGGFAVSSSDYFAPSSSATSSFASCSIAASAATASLVDRKSTRLNSSHRL